MANIFLFGGGVSVEPAVIEFTVQGAPYQVESGMTWAEFVESDYNPSTFFSINEGRVWYDQFMYITNPGSSEYVLATDVIISGGEYGMAP